MNIPSFEFASIRPYLVVALVIAMAIFGIYEVVTEEHRRSVRLKAFMEETKRDCDLEYKGVEDGRRINYVYICPDGTKREFSERL